MPLKTVCALRLSTSTAKRRQSQGGTVGGLGICTSNYEFGAYPALLIHIYAYRAYRARSNSVLRKPTSLPGDNYGFSKGLLTYTAQQAVDPNSRLRTI